MGCRSRRGAPCPTRTASANMICLCSSDHRPLAACTDAAAFTRAGTRTYSVLACVAQHTCSCSGHARVAVVRPLLTQSTIILLSKYRAPSTGTAICTRYKSDLAEDAAPFSRLAANARIYGGSTCCISICSWTAFAALSAHGRINVPPRRTDIANLSSFVAICARNTNLAQAITSWRLGVSPGSAIQTFRNRSRH